MAVDAYLQIEGILTPAWKKANPVYGTPSNDASEFFVVVVP